MRKINSNIEKSQIRETWNLQFDIFDKQYLHRMMIIGKIQDISSTPESFLFFWVVLILFSHSAPGRLLFCVCCYSLVFPVLHWSHYDTYSSLCLVSFAWGNVFVIRPCFLYVWVVLYFFLFLSSNSLNEHTTIYLYLHVLNCFLLFAFMNNNAVILCVTIFL